MSDTDVFRLNDLGDGITQLELNRPPANAMSVEVLKLLGQTLDKLEADENVRAVVVSSALGLFSAGLDLKEIKDFSETEQIALVDGLNSAFNRFYGFRKPVVAAINGAAAAGGMFFALVADYSVANTKARLGLTEIKVGVNFPVAPYEIAKAELSPGAFRRVLLSGRLFKADDALAMDIIDEIVPDEELLARAIAVAREYAGNPPRAYAAIKHQIRGEALANMQAAIDNLNDPTRAGGWFTDETMVAMDAILAATAKK
jgi:enoyl-CoA hydratase